MDTRVSLSQPGSGPNGGSYYNPVFIAPFVGSLAATKSRQLTLSSSNCPIPPFAKAIAANVTVVAPAGSSTGATRVTVYQGDGPLFPSTATTTNYFYAGAIYGVASNNAIVPVDATGKIRVFADQATDGVIDVTGFFSSDPDGMVFVPTPSCRLVDTRLPNAELTAYYNTNEPGKALPSNGGGRIPGNSGPSDQPRPLPLPRFLGAARAARSRAILLHTIST